MPKKETKKIVIILLLIDIIFIGVFVFLFYFTKSLITESISKENSIRTELKSEDGRILMKDDLASGKVFREKLMDYVIPSGGAVDFIETLERLVLSSGLKSDVKIVTNEAYDKGNLVGAELLRINMDVIGEWKNIQFFLDSLEGYPLEIDIKKMSLNKVSDLIIKNKTIPQWSGNFEFTVVKIKDIK